MKKSLIILSSAVLAVIIGSLLWYLMFGENSDNQASVRGGGQITQAQAEETAEQLRESIFSTTTRKSIANFKKSLFPKTEIEKELLDVKPENQQYYGQQPATANRVLSDREFLERLKNIEVSDDEIFRRMNPPHYLDMAAALQDKLINLGHIASEERLALNSEESLTKFFLKGLGYLRNIDPTNQNDYDRLALYLKTDWLGLRNSEADLTRMQIKLEKISGASSAANMAGEYFAYKTVGPANYKSGWLALLENIGLNNLVRLAVNLMAPQQTLAGWSTSPALPLVPNTGCYRDDLPQSLEPGVNLWAPCCNCGEDCAFKECSFVEDCGPYSSGCDIPNGCLNAVCSQCVRGVCTNIWLNAIWDEMTGICGCG